MSGPNCAPYRVMGQVYSARVVRHGVDRSPMPIGSDATDSVVSRWICFRCTPEHHGPMALDPAQLQQAAKDHLWMHFTRHGVLPRHRRARDRAWRGCLHLGRERQALPRRAGRPLREPARPRPHRPGRGGAPSRPSSWRSCRCGPTRTPTRSSSPQRVAGYAPGRPQPGLLHQRRRRGRRDRLEAGQELLQAHRQADEAQGDQPGDRLPRHHPGRAVDHRPAGAQAAVRAAGALDVPGAEHQHLPRARARRSTTPRRSAAGPPTRSPSRSRTRAPTPSPRSSSSRCRTPAAASRRRPATSSGSARSATSTTCCWSPTR